jgi:hypothetical protein
MGVRQAIAVTLIGIILAACGSGTVPAPSPPSPSMSSSPPPAMSAPTADPAPTPPLRPTQGPSPTAAQTDKPVPPKPTGIGWDTPCALDCGPGDNGGYRVTWKAPRTKGVEMRAYGVTTCFRTKATEGRCLRRGTPLPDDTRMLLAKGSASKGRLTLPLVGYGGMNSLGDWCAAVHRVTDDGEPIYSIVIAAYDENRHSIFAIVEPGRYNDGECAVDTY